MIPIGYLRAFMGLSLSYLIGRAMHTEEVKNHMDKLSSSMVTVLQLATLGISFAIMYIAPISWIYDPLYFILSAVLVALLTVERGGAYKLMQLVPYGVTKYSTSIYLSMHLLLRCLQISG